MVVDGAQVLGVVQLKDIVKGDSEERCTDSFWKSTADGHLDGFVDDAGVNVMATGDTGTRVDGDVPGGEDILPTPFLGGMRRLPSQSMG